MERRVIWHEREGREFSLVGKWQMSEEILSTSFHLHKPWHSSYFLIMLFSLSTRNRVRLYGASSRRYDYDYKIKSWDWINFDMRYVWNFVFLDSLPDGDCHPNTANDGKRDDSSVDYGWQPGSFSFTFSNGQATDINCYTSILRTGEERNETGFWTTIYSTRYEDSILCLVPSHYLTILLHSYPSQLQYLIFFLPK